MKTRTSVSFRCSCGVRADTSSDQKDVALRVNDLVRQAHLAMGHHEVGQAEYRRIRRRQRREEWREVTRSER